MVNASLGFGNVKFNGRQFSVNVPKRIFFRGNKFRFITFIISLIEFLSINSGIHLFSNDDFV